MSWYPETEEDKKVLAEVMADPFHAAVFEFESGNNPKAKNPKSSASGAFQLISRTAKALGVKDVFDFRDNYEGFKKLLEENRHRFGRDYETLYQAHYLGAPLLDKVLKNKPLPKVEAAIYDYYIKKVRPRFKNVLEKHLNRVAR